MDDSTQTSVPPPATSPLLPSPQKVIEHRTYSLTRLELEEEKVLLELTETKDIPSAFRELLNPICTVLFLMEKVDFEDEVSGYDLVCIAELIKFSVDKLERMQGLFDSIKLVSTKSLAE